MNEQEHVPMQEEHAEEHSPETSQQEKGGKESRLTWIVVGVVAVLVIIAGVVFYLQGEQGQPVEQPAEVDLQEVVTINDPKVKSCEDFEYDTDMYIEALNTGNVQLCQCITENEELKNTCINGTADAIKMQNAVMAMNATLCEEITEESTKAYCVQVVEDGITYFKENDPQALANKRMNAHDEAAITDYEALLEGEPDNLTNLLNLTLAYAEKGLREQEQGGDQIPYVEKALETIEKALAISATSSEVYRVEAYVYEIQPDLVKALELYDKALEIDPENILAYAGKGHVQRMIGLLPEALESFNKAAELDTEDREAVIYTNLCSLLYTKGDFEEAVKNCLKVRANEASDNVYKVSALRSLAEIAMANGDAEAAEAYLTEAVAIKPDESNIYILWATLDILKKDYSASEEHARTAVANNPTSARAQLALSRALYMQDRYEESIGIAEAGLALVDSDVSLLIPSKDAVTKELYYSIAFNYYEMDDTANYEKYSQLAEEAFISEQQ